MEPKIRRLISYYYRQTQQIKKTIEERELAMNENFPEYPDLADQLYEAALDAKLSAYTSFIDQLEESLEEGK